MKMCEKVPLSACRLSAMLPCGVVSASVLQNGGFDRHNPVHFAPGNTCSIFGMFRQTSLATHASHELIERQDASATSAKQS